MLSPKWITVGALAAGIVSYLAYFDYQRRHSPEFRREVRARNKRFSEARQKAEKQQKQRQSAEILDLIDTSLKTDPIPEDLKDREQFFITEISRADELTNSGMYVESALCFYRALSSYPQPMELLAFFEKTVNKEVLELVRAMVVMRPPAEVASFLKRSLNETIE